jgi:tRNA nucleotidyltransferase (CCA-adding enzyme)
VSTLGRRLLDRLPGPVAALLANLGAVTASGGARLWLVGGLVRDLWLGEPSMDIDLVVEGPVEPAIDAIAAAGYAVEPKGAAFGTYRLRVAERAAKADARLTPRLVIDLAAARRERYAHPAALPTVEAGSLDEDLRRRDVSLNAVAVLLDPEDRGRLADPTGGLADLAAGRLRALHPRSFEDDPTRAFRVARFAGRYGFSLEPDTARWLEAATAGGFVARLSGARVRAQIALLAAEPSPAGPLATHARLGLLAAAHQALAVDAAAVLRVADVWEAAAALAALGAPCGEPLGRLLRALLVGRPPAAVGGALARLGLQGAPAARLAAEIERLPRLAAELTGAAALTARALHDRLAPLDPAGLAVVLALAGPPGGRRVLHWATELAGRRPRVTGHDLQALGVAPGPEVGRLLDRLLTERLEGRLRSKDEEVALVRRLLGGEAT